MKNGSIYHINFNGNIGSEIDKIHLGIIFEIPKVKNMVFCIPLTSPKEKHFKSSKDFIERNHRELKYKNLFYIKETDSIALLDQLRSISTSRLIKSYKNKSLTKLTMETLIINTMKYLKNVIKLN